MNYQLDNLTSKQNINLFSTPKFRDNQFDKDNPNKNSFINFESLSKGAVIYGIKNTNLNSLENLNIEPDNLNKNNEDSNQNNQGEIILKENFSLSSLGNNYTNNDKINIINIKINSNKKKDKDEKYNIALMSFCDKIDNYSFNNYSCSTYKDKQEINNNNNINNMKLPNEIKFKESKIKNDNNNSVNSANINTNTHNSHNSNSHNSNSNSNENNSNSFKYNLPLENDKIPLINDFSNIQNNNNELDININNNNLNNENNTKNDDEKSLELDNNNYFEKINNSFKKNKSIKDNLLYQYKSNNISNDINFLQKQVKKCQTEKLCRFDKTFPCEKSNKNEINLQNKKFLEINTNNKNLVIKKNILHSYDNYKKIKRKIKHSIQNNKKGNKSENKEKFSSEKINKIISPRKKFELIIKQIDINTDKVEELNINIDEENDNDNDNQIFSFTSRDSKIRNSVPNELGINSDKKIETNFHVKNNYNYNPNNNNNDNDNLYYNGISNTTNKIRNKIRKFIKSTPLDYNKTFFNFNKNKENDKNNNNTHNINNIDNKSYDINFLNKNSNASYKSCISKNINKKGINNMNNQKYSSHTRNISNLYSNKIFNGIKNLFKNNNLIFNTINYETNDINKKNDDKNIIQTKIKFKPHIKNIINKTSFLNNSNNDKTINNTNKFYKKQVPHINLKNNNRRFKIRNNTNNNLNNKYNTIFTDKNKNHLNSYKKFKNINNLSKNNNKFKTYLFNNNNNSKNTENKNKSILKIPTSNIMSGAYTDRMIQDNNNYSSLNMEGKSNINDSIFININDSANSLQNESRCNKIKVNTIKKATKIQKFSVLNSDISNKTNSYWKIHKKPKNSCLLNNYNNNNNNEININKDKDINDVNDNNKYISLWGNSEKNMKDNSQILIFNKNKPNRLSVLNDIKDKIHQYNLTNNNSKSIISESSYTDRNNYNNNNSTNENVTIERNRKEIRNNQYLNYNKKKNKNYYKIYNKNKNNINNKSKEFLTKTDIGNYKSKMKNFKDEILKYSIIRNNKNNQVINEFSIVLGEEKDKNKQKDNDNKDTNNKSSEKSNKNEENRRTIINVNQFYPSYYIDTHEIIKNNKI